MENTQIKITAKQYTKPQVALLTKSMLIAGIAFIILGAASFGWCYLFTQTIDYMAQMNIGFLVFILTLISGMIVSMLWTANMFKSGSVPLTILCYGLYMLTISVAFGWLFSIAANFMAMWWLPVIFAITGGVFIIALMIAKLMSINGIMTMGKIIGATAIAMAVFLIVFLVLAIVTIATQSEGVALAADAITSFIMMGMALVSFLYVIIDIWQISKISEFQENTGTDGGKILPWFFGFKLLTDLVNVLFIVLLFVIRLAGRRN